MKMGEKIKKNLPLVKLLRPMMTMPACRIQLIALFVMIGLRYYQIEAPHDTR